MKLTRSILLLLTILSIGTVTYGQTGVIIEGGKKTTTPANGQVLKWDGSAWTPSADDTGASAGWGLTGNSGITNSNFIGPTNNAHLLFRTNNVQRMKLDSLGNLGIGTNTPLAALDVNGQVKYSVGNWTRESKQVFPAGSAPTYILLCPAPVGSTGNQRISVMGTIRAIRGTSSTALRSHTATFSFTSAQNTAYTHTIRNEGLTLISDVIVLKQVTYSGSDYVAIKLNTAIVSNFTTAWIDVTYNYETLPANFLLVTSTGVSKETHIPESRAYSSVNNANGNFGLGSLQPASKLTFNSSEVASIGVDRRIGVSTSGQSMSITAGGVQTGRISTFAPLLAGAGYVVGDTISVTKTFGTPALFQVSTVDGGGGITGLTLLTTGDSYSTGGSNTSTMSGTGSGATVNILTTVSGTNSGGGTLTLSSGISSGNQGSTMDFLTAGVSAPGATENTPALRMRITSGGDIGMGTTTPTGRLHIVSAGATSSTNNFLFNNSTPATILSGLDNGFIRVGNSGTFAPRFYSGSDATGGDVDLSGRNLVFNSRITNDVSALGNFLFTGTSLTHTTGTNICFRNNRTFAMPAGNATQIFNSLDYTISNTGAQTGSITGLTIRAIETALQGVTHNPIDVQVNSATILKLTNTGNLSVGLLNAGARLHVGGSVRADSMLIVRGTNATGAGLELINSTASTGANWSLETRNAGDLQFWRNGSYRGRFAGSGFFWQGAGAFGPANSTVAESLLSATDSSASTIAITSENKGTGDASIITKTATSGGDPKLLFINGSTTAGYVGADRTDSLAVILGVNASAVGTGARLRASAAGVALGVNPSAPTNGAEVRLQGDVIIDHVIAASPKPSCLYTSASGTSGTCTVTYGGDLGFHFTAQAGSVPGFGDYITITLANPLPLDHKPVAIVTPTLIAGAGVIYQLYIDESTKTNGSFRIKRDGTSSTSFGGDVHVFSGY